MRTAQISRDTSETSIRLSLSIDCPDGGAIETGSGFLDHMLTLFTRHGGFGLSVSCKGDTDVDFHHTVEDIGIALGEAFFTALGDKKGIVRYGSMLLPMDEALVLCAVDISGRACLRYSLLPPAQKVGDFDTELGKEFFLGFVRKACVTVHLRQLDGENSHHILEAGFKAFGRALSAACAINPLRPDEIPSTKGLLL